MKTVKTAAKGKDRPLSFMIFLFVLIVMLSGNTAALCADVNDLIFQGADYHYKGKLDEAIGSFQSVVQNDPRNEYAHNQLGILYTKKEKYDEAYREFSTVVSIDRRNTFALLWLGILYLFRKS
jgi:lipoprotein NlpI